MPKIINAYSDGANSIADSLKSLGESMFADSAKNELTRQSVKGKMRENDAAERIAEYYRQGDYRNAGAQSLRSNPGATNMGAINLAGTALDAGENYKDPRLATAAMGAGHSAAGTWPGVEEASRRQAATQEAIANRQLQSQEAIDARTLTPVLGDDNVQRYMPKSQAAGQRAPMSLDQTKAGLLQPYLQQPGQQSPSRGAISSVESGGKYDLMGPVTRTGDRAFGKYQVMGANVGPWTQEVLGRQMSPQEFLANPQAQDAVFDAKFGALSAKYGPSGAARAWFAGEGGMNDMGRKDILGTTVAGYEKKFNAAGGAGQPQQPTGLAAMPNDIRAVAGLPHFSAQEQRQQGLDEQAINGIPDLNPAAEPGQYPLSALDAQSSGGMVPAAKNIYSHTINAVTGKDPTPGMHASMNNLVNLANRTRALPLSGVTRDSVQREKWNNERIPQPEGILGTVPGGGEAARNKVMALISDLRYQYNTTAGIARNPTTPPSERAKLAAELTELKSVIDAWEKLPADAQQPQQQQQAPAATPQAATGVPQAGEVRKGYRFLGGDPSKQESWQKV